MYTDTFRGSTKYWLSYIFHYLPNIRNISSFAWTRSDVVSMIQPLHAYLHKTPYIDWSQILSFQMYFWMIVANSCRNIFCPTNLADIISHIIFWIHCLWYRLKMILTVYTDFQRLWHNSIWFVVFFSISDRDCVEIELGNVS